MQTGWHLTSIKQERLMRRGLLARPPKKLHDWCLDGVYVWRDLSQAQWWAGNRDGGPGRYNWLVEVDTEGLELEADIAGAQWLQRMEAAMGLDLSSSLGCWSADRVLCDVGAERIVRIHPVYAVWPSTELDSSLRAA